GFVYMSSDGIWLNYHHLHYFWLVAREGGLAPAAKLLRLSRPTVSTQVHALEESLGSALLRKEGRRLVLTEQGTLVFRYANEIFTLGREMVDTVQGRRAGEAQRLSVGVVDVVPKLVVRQLLAPALQQSTSTQLQVHEGSQESLLAKLALHGLHMVLADAPVPAGGPIRAFSHLLVDAAVTFFAAPSLAQRLSGPFPACLAGAPMLLPLEHLPLRRELNRWLHEHKIKPVIVGEFADSALLKTFGADGMGVFAAPTLIAPDLTQRYGVHALGQAERLHVRYFAITMARRVHHPGVQTLVQAARQAKGADPHQTHVREP
ncbi:MAG: transcriptional activator NhaR, partial [Polyangiales bacterium]